MKQSAPRKVFPLPATISQVITSSATAVVVEIVALPLSPVTTVAYPFVSVSVVVIVKLPERIVVPFFFTFTSKFPPTGRVPSEIASFENVTLCESLALFTTQAIGTPEVEYSRMGEGHPPAEGVYASNPSFVAFFLTDCPAVRVIAVASPEVPKVAMVLAVEVWPEVVQARLESPLWSVGLNPEIDPVPARVPIT